MVEQPLRDNKLQAKEDKEEMNLGMLIKNYQKKMTTNSKLKEVQIISLEKTFKDKTESLVWLV